MVEQIIHSGERKHLLLLNRAGEEWHFLQEADSRLCLHIVNLSIDTQSTDTKHDIYIEQQGENCQTEIYGLCFLRGKDQVALHTHMYHQVGHGQSRQLLKFVLADEAKGEFFGEMKIQPNAQKVEAQQTNRNLLLSNTATIRTRPQLEIYADDVKASHGASTGQLDESSLFYMQQRCISPEEGRKMLIKAFMTDIIETIEDETQKEKLMLAIDSVIQ